MFWQQLLLTQTWKQKMISLLWNEEAKPGITDPDQKYASLHCCRSIRPGLQTTSCFGGFLPSVWSSAVKHMSRWTEVVWMIWAVKTLFGHKKLFNAMSASLGSLSFCIVLKLGDCVFKGLQVNMEHIPPHCLTFICAGQEAESSCCPQHCPVLRLIWFVVVRVSTEVTRF